MIILLKQSHFLPVKSTKHRVLMLYFPLYYINPCTLLHVTLYLDAYNISISCGRKMFASIRRRKFFMPSWTLSYVVQGICFQTFLIIHTAMLYFFY